MINIAFDIDGCIVDLNEHLHRVICDYFQKDFKPIDIWDIEEHYGISEDEAWKFLIDVYCDPMETHIIEGASEFLHALFKENHKRGYIQFITSRPKLSSTMTYKMLDRIINDIPYQVAFGNHKLDYISNYKYIVEDAPHNIEKFVNNGISVFMPVYKYNQHLFSPYINRIGNMSDLLNNINLFIGK
jgi:hypothetical protein